MDFFPFETGFSICAWARHHLWLFFFYCSLWIKCFVFCGFTGFGFLSCVQCCRALYLQFASSFSCVTRGSMCAWVYIFAQLIENTSKFDMKRPSICFIEQLTIPPHFNRLSYCIVIISKDMTGHELWGISLYVLAVNLTSECSQQSHTCIDRILVQSQQFKIIKYINTYTCLYASPPPKIGSNCVVTDDTSMVHFSLWVLREVCEFSSSQYNFQLCNEMNSLESQLRIPTGQSCL